MASLVLYTMVGQKSTNGENVYWNVYTPDYTGQYSGFSGQLINIIISYQTVISNPPPPLTGFTAGQDLSGTSTAQTVIGLQDRPISANAPTTGEGLVWNGIAWAPGVVGGFTAGLDLSGSSTSQTVVGLQGRAISSSAPASTQVLAWNGSAWAPANGQAFTAGGDLSGSNTNQTIANLQGNTVSASSPVSGQLLGYNGTAWVPVTNPGNNTITLTASTAIDGYHTFTIPACPIGGNPATYVGVVQCDISFFFRATAVSDIWAGIRLIPVVFNKGGTIDFGVGTVTPIAEATSVTVPGFAPPVPTGSGGDVLLTIGGAAYAGNWTLTYTILTGN